MDILHSYIEKGVGKPIIMLHGNNENGSYFIHQMEEFGRDHRVICPDTRGHGKTPRGTAPFTIMQFADDLSEFMDRLGIQNADILGFSDGANIAMRFAMKYPEKVDHLILNGGNLNTTGIVPSTYRVIETQYKLAKKLSGKSRRMKHSEEMLGLMVNDPDILPYELLQIKNKTLVIAGTKDLILEEHTGLIAQGITDSTIAFVEGTHFVAKENYVRFNEIVRAFLEDRLDFSIQEA